jgi:hypothetical protein
MVSEEKVAILYDSIYMDYVEQLNPKSQKTDWCIPRTTG